MLMYPEGKVKFAGEGESTWFRADRSTDPFTSGNRSVLRVSSARQSPLSTPELRIYAGFQHTGRFARESLAIRGTVRVGQALSAQ